MTQNTDIIKENDFPGCCALQVLYGLNIPTDLLISQIEKYVSTAHDLDYSGVLVTINSIQRERVEPILLYLGFKPITKWLERPNLDSDTTVCMFLYTVRDHMTIEELEANT